MKSINPAATNSNRSLLGQEGQGQAELAYREIEERIVTLRLPPGALLSEQLLSKDLGIGRTPVREALQRLHYEGLVQIMPRRGVMVSEVDVLRQFRMLELRREVESFVVRMACRRGSDAEIAALGEIARSLDQTVESNDAMAFIRADQDMDRIIYQMARNEFATRTLQLMSGLTRRFWFIQHAEQGEVASCARLHADIAQAVIARDADLAVQNTDRLIGYIEDLTYQGMDAQLRSSDAANLEVVAS